MEQGDAGTFKLTLKAPKRITHDARLRDCADRVRQFLETASTLGPKLGALLFQLPPNLKKDLALFDAFLDAFPPRVCAAFEFRHASWLDEEIYARLRARNLALCVADSEKLSTPVEITADYGTSGCATRATRPTDIERWARRDSRSGRRSAGDVFVYFKHEESGKGPEFAPCCSMASARRAIVSRSSSGCDCGSEAHDFAFRPVAVVAAGRRARGRRSGRRAA